jgi:FlgN protein
VAFATNPVLETLATSVSDQLSALAHLEFKFEVQQMMLVGGRGVWVEETTRDLEVAIATVQRGDLVFRRALGEAAGVLGLSPESTLREVAEATDEPWSYIFGQGRHELQKAIRRIDELCAENRKLLVRGYLATSEALAMLGVADPAGYDASGAPVPGSTSIILNARA